MLTSAYECLRVRMCSCVRDGMRARVRALARLQELLIARTRAHAPAQCAHARTGRPRVLTRVSVFL